MSNIICYKSKILRQLANPLFGPCPLWVHNEAGGTTQIFHIPLSSHPQPPSQSSDFFPRRLHCYPIRMVRPLFPSEFTPRLRRVRLRKWVCKKQLPLAPHLFRVNKLSTATREVSYHHCFCLAACTLIVIIKTVNLYVAKDALICHRRIAP
jgi:hypothetical protein